MEALQVCECLSEHLQRAFVLLKEAWREANENGNLRSAWKVVFGLATELVKALVSYGICDIKKRLRYWDFREIGCLLGSRMMESAYKQIVIRGLERTVLNKHHTELK